jgi:LysR family transcriptional activator of nhaA
MQWLNYQHLLYFWTTARLGSVSRAAAELHLAQPTISSQLRSLEHSFGRKLFARRGRHVALTESGRVVFRYAEDIFALGRELSSAMRGADDDRLRRTLSIGVVSTLSMTTVGDLLEPALKFHDQFRISVRTAGLESMPADLAAHQFDFVLTDTPLPQAGCRLHHQLLGERNVRVLGTPTLAQRYRNDFPRSLDGAPMLLPIGNSPLRRALDEWFALTGISPRIVAEIEDHGLLRRHALAGHGVFAAPTVGGADSDASTGPLVSLGELTDVRQQFYLVTPEGRQRHPVVTAIFEGALKCLSYRTPSPRSSTSLSRDL